MFFIRLRVLHRYASTHINVRSFVCRLVMRTIHPAHLKQTFFPAFWIGQDIHQIYVYNICKNRSSFFFKCIWNIFVCHAVVWSWTRPSRLWIGCWAAACSRKWRRIDWCIDDVLGNENRRWTTPPDIRDICKMEWSFSRSATWIKTKPDTWLPNSRASR